MHEFFSPFTQVVPVPMLPISFLYLVIFALFALILKGFALWYSARAGQRNWFIALLVINTAGILEIVYLIYFRPKNSEESAVVPLPKDSEPVQS